MRTQSRIAVFLFSTPRLTKSSAKQTEGILLMLCWWHHTNNNNRLCFTGKVYSTPSPVIRCQPCTLPLVPLQSSVGVHEGVREFCPPSEETQTSSVRASSSPGTNLGFASSAFPTTCPTPPGCPRVPWVTRVPSSVFAFPSVSDVVPSCLPDSYLSPSKRLFHWDHRNEPG